MLVKSLKQVIKTLKVNKGFVGQKTTIVLLEKWLQCSPLDHVIAAPKFFNYAAFAPIVCSSVPREASLYRWREKIVFPVTSYTPVLYTSIWHFIKLPGVMIKYSFGVEDNPSPAEGKVSVPGLSFGLKRSANSRRGHLSLQRTLPAEIVQVDVQPVCQIGQAQFSASPDLPKNFFGFYHLQNETKNNKQQILVFL